MGFACIFLCSPVVGTARTSDGVSVCPLASAKVGAPRVSPIPLNCQKKNPKLRLFLLQPPQSTRRRSILSMDREKFRTGAAGCHGDQSPSAVIFLPTPPAGRGAAGSPHCLHAAAPSSSTGFSGAIKANPCPLGALLSAGRGNNWPG